MPQKKIRSLMDEISSLETRQKQLDGIEKELATANKELASVEADTTIKNAKLIELTKSVKVTEAAISSKQSALDNIQIQIKKLEETRLDLVEDISRLQGQQEVLKKIAEPAGPKQAG